MTVQLLALFKVTVCRSRHIGYEHITIAAPDARRAQSLAIDAIRKEYGYGPSVMLYAHAEPVAGLPRFEVETNA